MNIVLDSLTIFTGVFISVLIVLERTHEDGVEGHLIKLERWLEKRHERQVMYVRRAIGDYKEQVPVIDHNSEPTQLGMRVVNSMTFRQAYAQYGDAAFGLSKTKPMFFTVGAPCRIERMKQMG